MKIEATPEEIVALAMIFRGEEVRVNYEAEQLAHSIGDTLRAAPVQS